MSRAKVCEPDDPLIVSPLDQSRPVTFADAAAFPHRSDVQLQYLREIEEILLGIPSDLQYANLSRTQGPNKHTVWVNSSGSVLLEVDEPGHRDYNEPEVKLDKLLRMASVAPQKIRTLIRQFRLMVLKVDALEKRLAESLKAQPSKEDE